MLNSIIFQILSRTKLYIFRQSYYYCKNTINKVKVISRKNGYTQCKKTHFFVIKSSPFFKRKSNKDFKVDLQSLTLRLIIKQNKNFKKKLGAHAHPLTAEKISILCSAEIFYIFTQKLHIFILKFWNFHFRNTERAIKSLY